MDMLAHCVRVDHERLGNFFIALTFGNQNKHFKFTGG